MVVSKARNKKGVLRNGEQGSCQSRPDSACDVSTIGQAFPSLLHFLDPQGNV